MTTAIIISTLTWNAARQVTPDLRPRTQEESQAGAPASPLPSPLMTMLDLQEAPPANAYAITGDYLPPFLQAVLRTWKVEFPGTPLSANGIIFVIRPAEFYSDLSAEQASWLASREMLGIRNFPVIINPLTPNDDWYLRAQKEWKSGNDDAIYTVLASLFHEIAHSRQAADEAAAYQEQLALFGRFRKQGKLASAYARWCEKSLRSRYADLRRHPEQYVEVRVHFQNETVALLVHSPENGFTSLQSAEAQIRKSGKSSIPAAHRFD